MNATDPTSTTIGPRRKRRLFALGAIVVAAIALLVITAGGIGENLVYYWGPSEIKKAGDQAVGATIRLGGRVAPGSVEVSNDSSRLEFDVTDGSSAVHVMSNGIPPQLFREGIGVVVEGTMTRAGSFEATRLMVSHSNEYRAPESGEPVDPAKLMRTTEGLAEK